ncbi:MAG TPA: imidazolonepropionase [Syntrophomonadaceae bacterium]|nr:imidazolonepropionase [Syntrophomonadaceae bacterium]
MGADIIIRSNCIISCCEDSSYTTDGFVVIEKNRIIQVGEGDVPFDIIGPATRLIDARGQTVIPGLIDAHTHLIHAGSRENELALKLRGVPYLQILKQGGGILSTVAGTRKASKEELKAKARRSLDEMLIHGTTTVEAKSGYGLDLENEVKCLEAARELNQEHPVDIISTYLGAHAVPNEYLGNTAGYITFMTDQVMPWIASHNLAEFMDVFCEDGVFSPDEARILMKSGQNLGFKLKIHADEIVPLQGAELAAEMQAISADHLLAASDAGLKAMAKAGVTAVLLPGTSFYLMMGRYANVRTMIDMGIRVALATDYNPGTCPTENLQAVMTFACFGMKLSPEEILRGMTINAAYALDRAAEIGTIEAGKRADLVILNAPNWNYVIYHFGINHVDKVLKNGILVAEQGRLV